MPTGIYKRTKYHRKRISDALKKIGHKPPTLTGKDSSNWKGGKIFRSGYIYILKPEHPNSGKQGYIAEHRLVMEKHLGRFLNKKETIHHIDGNQSNNILENLKLFATRGKHTKYGHPEVAQNNSILNKR